jgi:ABC-type uncharacterized transport system substrate-binding protein
VTDVRGSGTRQAPRRRHCRAQPTRVLLLLALLATPGQAPAHPHVFVEYSFDLLFAGDGLAGLRVTWVFDEFFSSLLLQTYDANRDGRFSPDEVHRLEREQFSYFRPFNYNTELLLNGAPVRIQAASDFLPSVHNHRVAFTFTLPLAAPHQRQGTLEIIVDDPDYYFAMAYDARTPARVVPMGHAQVACARTKERQPSRPFAIACTFGR